MTSRELVYATLDFQGPDRLPRQAWTLPIAFQGREAEMQALLARYPDDIVMATWDDPLANPDWMTKGTSLDGWGCEWLVLQDGYIGEVKGHPFSDYAAMRDYAWPMGTLDDGWANTATSITEQRDKFITGYAGSPWERMQYLRGSEDLYVDLADPDCDEVYELRDRVFAYFRGLTERFLQYDIDGMVFSDDWGSQRSLLISPAKWREFFKPKYQEIIDIIKDAGKKVFFHSDGNILDIYPDLINMGVDALNSQIWCMGIEHVAQYAGQITFWGELDRQHVLPHGTPDEVREQAHLMFQHLYRNGGLIGQESIEQVWHIENVEAALSVWETFKTR